MMLAESAGFGCIACQNESWTWPLHGSLRSAQCQENPRQSQRRVSKAAEQVRQTGFQTLWHFLDVYQRHVPHPALEATVVGSVQPATLCSLFLIDPLRLAYAADRTAEPNPDIDRHHLKSSWWSDNEYTPNESHRYRLVCACLTHAMFVSKWPCDLREAGTPHGFRLLPEKLGERD